MWKCGMWVECFTPTELQMDENKFLALFEAYSAACRDPTHDRHDRHDLALQSRTRMRFQSNPNKIPSLRSAFAAPGLAGKKKE